MTHTNRRILSALCLAAALARPVYGTDRKQKAPGRGSTQADCVKIIAIGGYRLEKDDQPCYGSKAKKPQKDRWDESNRLKDHQDDQRQKAKDREELRRRREQAEKDRIRDAKCRGLGAPAGCDLANPGRGQGRPAQGGVGNGSSRPASGRPGRSGPYTASPARSGGARRAGDGPGPAGSGPAAGGGAAAGGSGAGRAGSAGRTGSGEKRFSQKSTR